MKGNESEKNGFLLFSVGRMLSPLPSRLARPPATAALPGIEEPEVERIKYQILKLKIQKKTYLIVLLFGERRQNQPHHDVAQRLLFLVLLDQILIVSILEMESELIRFVQITPGNLLGHCEYIVNIL
jgi:hypothetical protein